MITEITRLEQKPFKQQEIEINTKLCQSIFKFKKLVNDRR